MVIGDNMFNQFFKDNTGYELNHTQQAILDVYNNYDDIVIDAERCTGKTTLINMLAIYESMNNNSYLKNVIITNSKTQESAYDNHNVEFVNNPEQLRGKQVNRIYIDDVRNYTLYVDSIKTGVNNKSILILGTFLTTKYKDLYKQYNFFVANFKENVTV